MPTKISPWSDSVNLASPDGKLVAAIDDADEIAMGAPTSGTLKVSDGSSYQRCSPSMVWSDDSRYLAVPQWTFSRQQRLLVISPERKCAVYLPGIFSVLELHSFSDGKIKGINSPIYLPRPVEIDVGEVRWEDIPDDKYGDR